MCRPPAVPPSTLQKVACLRELDNEYLKKLVDALHARNVEKGEVQYRDGETCATF